MKRILACLTVRNPWASLIVSGEKTFEGRSRRVVRRSRIGIIAAAGADRPHGLLGTVDLVDCVSADGLELPPHCLPGARWYWVLANPVAFPAPVPMPGSQGWKYVEIKVGVE